MSDPIKHECGVALLRLLKPLEYYQQKYGDALYGIRKMYVLLEKQKNRGQDGAGLATIKLDVPQGKAYINRKRSTSTNAIQDIFSQVLGQFATVQEENPELLKNSAYLKSNFPFVGELFLGHLRYATHGNKHESVLHPRIRSNNWLTRNLVVAGNFNLTNVNELFETLINLGQYPREKSDTMTILEKIGHFLDEENNRLHAQLKVKNISNHDITPLITELIDYNNILIPSAADFDGGYLMAGMVGHGDGFVMRDPAGIRPAYYYHDDEIFVVASERPALQTSFRLHRSKIKEVKPGSALVIRKNGTLEEIQCRKPEPRRSCSFERIYFSRGNDYEIYQERKKLGKLLVPRVIDAIDSNFQDTVFSYIPNTAEVSFYGLVEGVHDAMMKKKIEQIFAQENNPDKEKLKEQLQIHPRVEKIAIKDNKLRTFITEDGARDDLVSHVYDVTYGIVKNNVDTLVVVDDSIVRGTTLEKSILTMLDRLVPKKIIVVSSAPQIRYPDCYGIDMSKMGNFVAFRAAIALLKDRNMDALIREVYHACLVELKKSLEQMENVVKRIYDPFSVEEIESKIAEIVRPKHIFSEVQVIYQTIDNLHKACPDHLGDWYFTGNYPTPGGNRAVLNAFKNYFEGKNVRAY